MGNWEEGIDFEVLILTRGYGRDAHKQGAFISGVAHHHSALQIQVTK